MITRSKGAWCLCGVVMVAAGIMISYAMRDAARRSVALEAARQQNSELRELKDRNRKLLSGQISKSELDTLMREQREAAALRGRLATLQERNARADGHVENETLAAASWIYRGQQTPKAALESALWAASRGETDTLAHLLAFSPRVRSGIQAMISQLPPAEQQQYGTPERLIASLMAASLPENISAVTPGSSIETASGASLNLDVEHSDGQSTNILLLFSHTADGWCLNVPPDAASTYLMMVFGPHK